MENFLPVLILSPMSVATEARLRKELEAGRLLGPAAAQGTKCEKPVPTVRETRMTVALLACVQTGHEDLQLSFGPMASARLQLWTRESERLSGERIWMENSLLACATLQDPGEIAKVATPSAACRP